MCSTLYYMTTLTIRLDDELDSDLRKFAARTGKGKSEFVREAIVHSRMPTNPYQHR